MKGIGYWRIPFFGSAYVYVYSLKLSAILCCFREKKSSVTSKEQRTSYSFLLLHPTCVFFSQISVI